MNRNASETSQPITQSPYSFRAVICTIAIGFLVICPLTLAIGGIPAFAYSIFGLTLASILSGRDQRQGAMALFVQCFELPLLFGILFQQLHHPNAPLFIYVLALTILFAFVTSLIHGGMWAFLGWQDSKDKIWELSIRHGVLTAMLFIVASGTSQYVMTRAQDARIWEIWRYSFQDLRNTTVPAITIAILCSVVYRASWKSGVSFGIWLTPRAKYFSKIRQYFTKMAVPLGSFVCGYLAIIFIFAGFYGTLFRLTPEAFKGLSGEANFLDALYFSVVTATTVGYGDILPVSLLARCLAGLEAIFCLGWVVIVFAAITIRDRE